MILIKNLKILKRNNNNFKNLSYDIWLKQCASTVNLYIYENTNFLKILSQNSQETLDKKSKDFKIIRENNAYDKLVKFIIIDKTKKNFLTNDTDNLDFIKKTLTYFPKKMENYLIMFQIKVLGIIYLIILKVRQHIAAILNL